MRYKSAIIMSHIEAMNAALAKMIVDMDEDDFIRTQIKISKVFKRYLDSPVVAESYAEKLGSYSIKQVDDYLKSLKEGK